VEGGVRDDKGNIQFFEFERVPMGSRKLYTTFQIKSSMLQKDKSVIESERSQRPIKTGYTINGSTRIEQKLASEIVGYQRCSPKERIRSLTILSLERKEYEKVLANARNMSHGVTHD